MECSTKSYEETNVQGMSQLDLIIKVYDGALAAYRDAAKCFNDADNQEGCRHLDRARRFVVHLYTTLDEEKGAEIASGLSKLYSFVVAETDVVAATKDVEKIEDLITIINNLREGWIGLRDQGEPAALENATEAALEEPVGSFTTTA